VSYENDRNTDLAPRKVADYRCPKGHHVPVTFAAEAEPPPTWECRSCGATAVLAGGELPEPKKTRPVRTHMDMLRERRSTADLEEVLKEQIQLRAAKRKKSA
jgi:hypothetical protein